MGGGNQAPPYTPEHRDPYDRAVDAVGKHLQPLPIRNGKGSDIPGPRNPDRERQQPDMVRPPSTDRGTMPNLKWSFADSHMRIEVRILSLRLGISLTVMQEGGWARQTTIRELPTSVQLAGVNMRLEEGAVRELHWHKEVGRSTCRSDATRLKMVRVNGLICWKVSVASLPWIEKAATTSEMSRKATCGTSRAAIHTPCRGSARRDANFS